MGALWSRYRKYWVPFWGAVILVEIAYFGLQSIETLIGVASMGVALWIASSQGRKEEQRHAERKNVLIMSLSAIIVQVNDECNRIMIELQTIRNSELRFVNLSPALERIKQLSRQMESIDLLSDASPQIVLNVSRFLGALHEFSDCVDKAVATAKSVIVGENDPFKANRLVRDLYIDSAGRPLRVIQTTTANFFSARSDIERGCYSGSVG